MGTVQTGGLNLASVIPEVVERAREEWDLGLLGGRTSGRMRVWHPVCSNEGFAEFTRCEFRLAEPTDMYRKDMVTPVLCSAAVPVAFSGADKMPTLLKNSHSIMQPSIIMRHLGVRLWAAQASAQEPAVLG